jgi:hypothetical protein
MNNLKEYKFTREEIVLNGDNIFNYIRDKLIILGAPIKISDKDPKKITVIGNIKRTDLEDYSIRYEGE